MICESCIFRDGCDMDWKGKKDATECKYYVKNDYKKGY